MSTSTTQTTNDLSDKNTQTDLQQVNQAEKHVQTNVSSFVSSSTEVEKYLRAISAEVLKTAEISMIQKVYTDYSVKFVFTEESEDSAANTRHLTNPDTHSRIKEVIPKITEYF